MCINRLTVALVAPCDENPKILCHKSMIIRKYVKRRKLGAANLLAQNQFWGPQHCVNCSRLILNGIRIECKLEQRA